MARKQRDNGGMNNLLNATSVTSHVTAVQDKIKNQAIKLSIPMLRMGTAPETPLYDAAKGEIPA